MYIIIISILSISILLFTAWKQFQIDSSNSTNKTKKPKQKHGFLSSESLLHIVQEVVIVFYSAILAIWLSGYVENIKTQNYVESLMEAACNSEINQISQVSGVLKDMISNNNGTILDKTKSVNTIIKSKNSFIESVLQNDTVISQLNPLSYISLDICMENISIDIAGLEDELKLETLNELVIADYIASYCYYSYEIAFYFDCISNDVDYNLWQLALIDSKIKSGTVYYSAYMDSLKDIEEIFGVELTEWKEKSF